MDRFTEAFRTELAAFVEVTKGGPVLGATVADAVEVAWLAEAATESLRRGVAGHDRGGRRMSVDGRSAATGDQDRRSADLVGRLRGARLGLPVGAASGC